jgi:hypothetical protein
MKLRSDVSRGAYAYGQNGPYALIGVDVAQRCGSMVRTIVMPTARLGWNGARARQSSRDSYPGVEEQLAVDSQSARSDQRRRVPAPRVRTDEAFEHVRNSVSISVEAHADNSWIELEPFDLLALKLSHDHRPPDLELSRRTRWTAAAPTRHRAEHQLHFVAIAVAIGVAPKERRPARRLFLLSQRHGINASGPILVFRRDLLEQNDAVQSAESVEAHRSLGPGRIFDVHPWMPREVMAHRAKGAPR